MTALPQTTNLALQMASPAHMPVPGSVGEEEILVRTRFGVVAATPDAIIEMPHGPLGFAQHRRFVMADLPNPKLAQFKLLQSLSAPDVSFVVAGFNPESGLLAAADIDQGCAEVGFTAAERAVLLILTVRQEGGKVAMSVNLRAPIVVDLQRRLARQIVLGNPAYSIRHPF
jgi:flagellar assembly factor FliW